jgi:hypothetical protein
LTSSEQPNTLEKAIESFNQTLSNRRLALTDAQRAQFALEALTVEHVLAFGRSIKEGWQPGKNEKVLRNCNKLLKSLQAYAPTVEVFIRAAPVISAIVWGGIKLVLMVCCP